MYSGGDDIGALVADFGSYATKIGYAGNDCPTALFQTAVGVVSENSTGTSTGSAGHTLIHDFRIFRDNMAIDSPIKEGLIVNWDMLEEMWEHALSKYFHNQQGDLRDTPLLFTEKPYNTPVMRHRLVERMFEKYQTPAMFLSKDVVLSCYACGKTSGLAIDMGGSGSVIAPILDGWVEPKGIMRTPLGGRLMDAQVEHLFPKSEFTPGFRLKKVAKSDSTGTDSVLNFGHVDVSSQNNVHVCINPAVAMAKVHPSYEAFMRLEVYRDVKEAMSRMSDTPPISDDARFKNLPLIPYELPDGTTIDVGIERFLIPEMYIDPSPVSLSSYHLANLFNPDSKGPIVDYSVFMTSSEGDGTNHTLDSIPKLVTDSVTRCETDQQAMLLANMILGGGSACVEGLTERLKTEIESTMFHSGAPGWRCRLFSVAPTERAIVAWLGGSILASLGSFHELWISRQEYEEFGTSIVDRKCP